MKNEKFLPISIIVLALSIVFGSIWIGQAIKEVIDVQASNPHVSVEKALLTEEESAEYLNITLEEFKDILIKDNQHKANLSVYPAYQFIPYIEISKGKKMFSRKELDEWVKYNSLNK